MRSMIRAAAMAATLGLVAASTLEAQARRSSAVPARPPVQAPSGGGMQFTLLGGVATGEEGIDLGFAIGGSFEWDMAGWPVNLRVDPYIARHEGDCGGFADCSLMIIGAGVNAAYDFPTSSGSRALPLQGASTGPSWYVFGGLGIYRSSFDVDTDVPGFDFGGDETDLGIQLGGGAKFGGRYRGEIRYMSIDSFSTIPLLFGITF